MKAAVSLLAGLAFATVGMDTVSGELRLTFGFTDLLRGISFLVAVIGLFGIGELLLTVQEEMKFKGVSSKIEIREIFKALARLPHYWVTFLRSAAVGVWMGITPGGPTAASFMSYGLGRRFGKYGKNFGKGEPEGVIAPETADHSAGTSALLPMLALGVPGSATAAVMMGGLMIWGLQPGPLLFVEQPDFVWGLIASMYMSNIIAVILVLATVPLFASILRIPFGIIGPIIIVVCLIGALYGGQCGVRCAHGRGLRHRRLHLQAAGLSDCTAGAGHGSGRQGRGRLPPVHALLGRFPVDLLVQRPCRQHHGPGDPASPLADPVQGSGLPVRSRLGCRDALTQRRVIPPARSRAPSGATCRAGPFCFHG